MKPNGHINGEAKEHAGPGRPRLEIDAEQVERMAGIGCTTAEIASVLDCSSDTIERNFAASLKKGREDLHMSLRRRQLEVALNGSKEKEYANPTMLIWLGKTLLGQRDRVEVSGPGGGPIQHEHINFDNLTHEQLSDLERLVESATAGDRAGS